MHVNTLHTQHLESQKNVRLPLKGVTPHSPTISPETQPLGLLGAVGMQLRWGGGGRAKGPCNNKLLIEGLQRGVSGVPAR